MLPREAGDGTGEQCGLGAWAVCGGEQGWGRDNGGRRRGLQKGEGNLFYNKNRSSDLSRTGLWEPHRPPHAEGGRVGVGGGDGRGARLQVFMTMVPGAGEGLRSQLLRDFECWISHCRVMSMLSFSLQEME